MVRAGEGSRREAMSVLFTLFLWKKVDMKRYKSETFAGENLLNPSNSAKEQEEDQDKTEE